MERQSKQNKRRIIISDETYQAMRSDLQAAYQETDDTLKTLLQILEGNYDPKDQLEKQRILKSLDRFGYIPKIIRKIQRAMQNIERIEDDPNPTPSDMTEDPVFSAIPEVELGKYPEGLHALVTMRYRLGEILKRVERFEELHPQDPKSPVI